MFIDLLRFENITCHLTIFGKTSNEPSVLFRRVSRVSLKLAHIYQKLFKAKFQAIFALPELAIIVKNEK